MPKNTYLVDPADEQSVEALIDAVNAHSGPFEAAIRVASGLHHRPFSVFIDYLHSTSQQSPMFDRFTFDMDTDELIVFSDEPPVLVDALLEMAMFMRGFNTLIGVEGEWKVQVAIGAWRRIRESLKQQLGLPFISGRVWSVALNADGVEQLDSASFAVIVTLAGCPDVEVQFPDGTSPKVIGAYKHLNRIVDLVAQSLGLADAVEFNRRLHRAVTLIEEQIAPKPIDDAANGGAFDDLFGNGPAF